MAPNVVRSISKARPLFCSRSSGTRSTGCGQCPHCTGAAARTSPLTSGVGCDIGDLPIGAHAFRMEPSDCDALDFAAAEGPPRKLQAFRLKPSPAWLVGFCCSFLFCFMGEVLRNLGV